VIRIGNERDISLLNPFIGTRSTDHGIRTLLYEPLVTFDRKMDIRPYLAESWTISKDGKDYTFKLRKNVRFHDGQEMTAGDVQWSFEYTMNPKNAAYGRNFLEAVSSLQILDPHTVRFVLKQPQASFLAGLGTIQNLFVIPKGSLKEAERPKQFPTGTGPFQFAEWQPSNYLRLKRSAYYWQQGLPYAGELFMRPIEDGAVRFSAVRAGDVDVVERVPTPFALQVRKGEFKDLGYAAVEAAGRRAYMFNVKIPPFDNVKVRQAIAYAMDKEEVLRGAFWGWGTVINQKMHPESKWYFPIPDRKRDVAKARQLLKEAGYPSGLTIKIHCRKGNEEEVQILQSKLKEAGIIAEIDMHDPVTYMTKLRGGEAGFATFGGDVYPDPDLNYYGDFHSEQLVDSKVKDRMNFSGYSNPRVDKLLEEGRVVLDPKKRFNIYKQAFEIIQEEVPVIFSLEIPFVFVYGSALKNFQPDAHGRYFGGAYQALAKAWVEK
jgi:ABC-type transport system substrate-binding protein